MAWLTFVSSIKFVFDFFLLDFTSLDSSLFKPVVETFQVLIHVWRYILCDVLPNIVQNQKQRLHYVSQSEWGNWRLLNPTPPSPRMVWYRYLGDGPKASNILMTLLVLRLSLGGCNRLPSGDTTARLPFISSILLLLLSLYLFQHYEPQNYFQN